MLSHPTELREPFHSRWFKGSEHKRQPIAVYTNCCSFSPSFISFPNSSIQVGRLYTKNI